MKRYLLYFATFLFISSPLSAQNYSEYNQQFVAEHIYQGFPSYDNIHIRQAYIMSYNHDHRIANWVAYHVVPDYTNTVPRYSRFSAFRTDYDIPNAVSEDEYDGLYEGGNGYARGHLAPFNISGGDRDNDGLYGVADTNGDGTVNRHDMIGLDPEEYIADPDEISRVYEVNNMSNIVPQDHDGFNGESGVWRDLEKYIQGTLVDDQKKEVWVIAGTILGRGEMERVGTNKDVTVPPMFFKIVIRESVEGTPIILAFLLPHHKKAHGDIEDFLVSVDIIEAMTGLDFFREVDDEAEDQLESEDTWVNWKKFN